LYFRIFDTIQDLEKAILREDEFGIFLSGEHSVKCALQPFVRDGYKRSDKTLQDEHGVCVYYIGNSKSVGICCD
jgi:hypothetical protein